MKRLVFLLTLWVWAAASNASTVWSGPDVFVDQATDPDVLIAGVASLERGDRGLLCNVLGGDACNPFDFAIPSDFEFAFSGLNGNGAIAYGTAANFAAYSFADMYNAADSGPGFVFPNAGNALEPVSGVAHIISADVYIDFEILLWGTGSSAQAGQFAYRRSSLSTVPIPAAAWLFGSALLGLVGLVRRKRA